MDETETTRRDQPGEMMSYAARESPAKEPKLPGPPIRIARRLLYVVVLLLIVGALPLWTLAGVAMFLAVLVSIMATGAAIVALHRSTNPAAPDSLVPSKRSRFTIMASTLLCLGLSILGLDAMVGDFAPINRTSSVLSTLSGLGTELDRFHEQFGIPADSIGDLQYSWLVSHAYSGESAGTSVFRAAMGPSADDYSCFEYHRCPDSLRGDNRVLVLHEAQPWTVMWAGLHKRYGRCVLFADGHVEVLSEDAFAAAMALDAEVRKNAELPLRQE